MGIGSLFGRLMGGGAASTGFDAVKAAVENGSATIIDVREAHEFASGHIPGSINLPLSRFDPACVPTGKPVIAVCLSGARSGQATSICARAGREDVTNFTGGIAIWRLQGGTLIR